MCYLLPAGAESEVGAGYILVLKIRPRDTEKVAQCLISGKWRSRALAQAS